MKKNYWSVEFESIPTNNSLISYADVWETSEYSYDGQTINLNKFGFDPNDAYRYFRDEYWSYSDDYRIRNRAQDAINRQQELVRIFKNNGTVKQPTEEYIYLNDYHPLKVKEDREHRRINVQINRWSAKYPWHYEAESEEGKQFLLYVLCRRNQWKPGLEIKEIERLTLMDQRVFEINGEKIVEVRCYD